VADQWVSVGVRWGERWLIWLIFCFVRDSEWDSVYWFVVELVDVTWICLNVTPGPHSSTISWSGSNAILRCGVNSVKVLSTSVNYAANRLSYKLEWHSIGLINAYYDLSNASVCHVLPFFLSYIVQRCLHSTGLSIGLPTHILWKLPIGQPTYILRSCLREAATQSCLHGAAYTKLPTRSCLHEAAYAELSTRNHEWKLGRSIGNSIDYFK
jgi:hypothetical protein